MNQRKTVFIAMTVVFMLTGGILTVVAVTKTASCKGNSETSPASTLPRNSASLDSTSLGNTATSNPLLLRSEATCYVSNLDAFMKEVDKEAARSDFDGLTSVALFTKLDGTAVSTIALKEIRLYQGTYKGHFFTMGESVEWDQWTQSADMLKYVVQEQKFDKASGGQMPMIWGKFREKHLILRKSVMGKDREEIWIFRRSCKYGCALNLGMHPYVP